MKKNGFIHAAGWCVYLTSALSVLLVWPPCASSLHALPLWHLPHITTRHPPLPWTRVPLLVLPPLILINGPLCFLDETLCCRSCSAYKTYYCLLGWQIQFPLWWQKLSFLNCPVCGCARSVWNFFVLWSLILNLTVTSNSCFNWCQRPEVHVHQALTL